MVHGDGMCCTAMRCRVVRTYTYYRMLRVAVRVQRAIMQGVQCEACAVHAMGITLLCYGILCRHATAIYYTAQHTDVVECTALESIT